MDRVGHGRELGLYLVLANSFERWITWITLHNFRGEEERMDDCFDSGLFIGF